jgi:hypothetical protein
MGESRVIYTSGLAPASHTQKPTPTQKAHTHMKKLRIFVPDDDTTQLVHHLALEFVGKMPKGNKVKVDLVQYNEVEPINLHGAHGAMVFITNRNYEGMPHSNNEMKLIIAVTPHRKIGRHLADSLEATAAKVMYHSGDLAAHDLRKRVVSQLLDLVTPLLTPAYAPVAV